MATFSLSDTSRRAQATGNGSAGPFSFSFQVNSQSDLKVYVDTTLKTLTTHYTVTVGASGTGSVSFTSGNHPTSSQTVTILSDVPVSRTSVYTAGGNITASALESDFDTQTMMLGDREERESRTVMAPVDDPTSADMTLPGKDTRKGKVLGFNATTGNPEAGPEIADVQSLAGVSADIQTLAHIEDGTNATDAIQTVAGIASNVSTVAGVSSAVSTVAGISSNVSAVAADATDIGVVAGKATEIGRLGTAQAVADLDILATTDAVSDMNTLASISSNITTAASVATNITSTANNSSNITTVAGSISNVNTVASNISNVNTVAGISSNVTTVAGITSDISTANSNATNINLVATNINNVNDVANSITKVTTVSDNITNVNTVAPYVGNLSTVANSISNINTLAPISADITTVAGVASSVGSAAANAAAAESAKVAAVAAQAAAELAADNFDDTYLGAKSSDPTADNDGDALTAGDLYFSTTDNNLKVYTGSAWQAAALDASGFVDVTGDSMTGNLLFGDGNAVRFGTHGDLTIEHDLNNSNITGSNNRPLNITTNGTLNINSDNIFFREHAASNTYMEMRDGGGYDHAVRIFHSGTDVRLETTSTGIAVTGNATFADNGKAIFGAGSDLQIYHNGSHSYIQDVGTGRLYITTNGDEIRLTPQGGGENGLRVQQDGAVNLYYDNGEKLATTSTGIDVTGTVTVSNGGFYKFGDGTVRIYGETSADIMTFVTNNAEAMRLTSAGNLIVGGITDGASSSITLQNDGDIRGVLASGAGGDSLISAISGVSNGYQITVDTSNNQTYKWYNGGTQSMTLDSSGNLLVGKTSENTTTVGIQARADGLFAAVKSGAVSGIFGRNTDDGDIMLFRKDGTTVGSIGVGGSGDLYIGDGDTALLIDGESDLVAPWNTSTNLVRDNAIDLGYSSGRFKDLYLSGGVYLGGTGSANKLDDYEEGTFTPTLAGSTTTGTWTYTHQAGSYTKIGNKVTVFFNVYGSHSGAVGSLRVLGMPFACNTESVGSFQANRLHNGYQSNVEQYTAVIQSGETHVHFRGTKGTNSDYIAMAVGTVEYLRVTCTYTTNS